MQGIRSMYISGWGNFREVASGCGVVHIKGEQVSADSRTRNLGCQYSIKKYKTSNNEEHLKNKVLILYFSFCLFALIDQDKRRRAIMKANENSGTK